MKQKTIKTIFSIIIHASIILVVGNISYCENSTIPFFERISSTELLFSLLYGGLIVFVLQKTLNTKGEKEKER